MLTRPGLVEEKGYSNDIPPHFTSPCIHYPTNRHRRYQSRNRVHRPRLVRKPFGDGPGNWGTPYLHTRHGTKSNDSFSFSFTGQSSSVRCRSYPLRPISIQEHISRSSARHISLRFPSSTVQATGRCGIPNGNVS